MGKHRRTWVPTVPLVVVELLHAIDSVRLLSQCERVGAPVHVTEVDVAHLNDATRRAGL